MCNIAQYRLQYSDKVVARRPPTTFFGGGEGILFTIPNLPVKKMSSSKATLAFARSRYDLVKHHKLIAIVPLDVKFLHSVYFIARVYNDHGQSCNALSKFFLFWLMSYPAKVEFAYVDSCGCKQKWETMGKANPGKWIKAVKKAFRSPSKERIDGKDDTVSCYPFWHCFDRRPI